MHIAGASDPDLLARTCRRLAEVDGHLEVQGGALHVELTVEADDPVAATQLAVLLLHTVDLRREHITQLKVVHERRTSARQRAGDVAERPQPTALP